MSALITWVLSGMFIIIFAYYYNKANDDVDDDYIGLVVVGLIFGPYTLALLLVLSIILLITNYIFSRPFILRILLNNMVWLKLYKQSLLKELESLHDFCKYKCTPMFVGEEVSQENKKMYHKKYKNTTLRLRNVNNRIAKLENKS